MYIMVSTIITEENMKDVPREPQSTMVIHRLNGSEGEEEDSGPGSHAGDKEGERLTSLFW